MNEEWRIAAECAVSSGGVPVTFAVCTGGRLTIRELFKCVQGRIGESCFGPNNTIRKFFENAFHDLLNGPGEGNDIVKGLNEVRNFAQGIGDGMAHARDELDKQACNLFGIACSDGKLLGLF
jgi:hypothetical protein